MRETGGIVFFRQPKRSSKNKMCWVKRKSHWAFMTMIMGVIILFFGLRPKGHFPVNHVRWSSKQAALQFRNPGIAYVDDFSKLANKRDLKGLSIEMVVKAYSKRRQGYKPLLVISDGDARRQLTVWQWGKSIIAMNGDDYDFSRRWPRVSAKNVFLSGKKRYLTITAGKKGTRIYVDGKLASENREFKLSIPQSRKKLTLIMGNSVSGKNSWSGCIYGLSISGVQIPADEVARRFRNWKNHRSFDVRQSNDPTLLYTLQKPTYHRIHDRLNAFPPLEIPARVKPLKIELLSPPWHDFRLNRFYAADVALNLFGFAPLGFLLCGWLQSSDSRIRGNGFIVAAAACLMLSLTIECAQAYIPGRDSSIQDLVLNTFGGGMGGVLFDRWTRLR